MEPFIEFSKVIRKTFERFHEDDVKRFELFESQMKEAIECEIAPGMKKQRTSLEEDIDSGVDATTITTSTQASTVTSSTSGSTRPSRSAKTIASGNLKLPKLGTKLRQEIKLEPITETSSISTTSKTSDTKENDCNSINIKRERISVNVRAQMNNSNETDSSILVIPNEVNIITLSDDDDEANKMPPPTMPAPKKVAAKKTRTTAKNTSNAESNSSQETNSSQNSEASTQLETKKTKKGKKTKKVVLPMVEVKKEKISDELVLPKDEPSQSQKTVTGSSSQKEDGDSVGSKNATLESVYEDASDKIPSQQMNGLAASATYVLGKENGTTKQAVGKAKSSFSSIITEDDSDDDLPLRVPTKNTNKSKELFNPCIQSPMKAKVAAFEKQMQEFSSPAPPVRQTRTKTRQQARQNAQTSTGSASSAGSSNSTSRLPKPTTPSVEIRYPIKDHTPIGRPMHTSASSLQKTQPTSSSSKVGSVPRPATVQPLKIRSRDNSVEDMARGKEALLEKKRKADERVKRAQMQREAQDREKMEKVERLLKQKQEKEAAREAAKQQKQQQEAQKQLKAIEQKREKERKLKAELAEAAKQERDLILSKKIADEKAYLEQMKNSKKEEPKLTFDMLETDDSTDDEDTASKSRPNRPPPPAWSLRANSKREIIMQAGVSVNTIDKLFSCKPTTPDLAAIFPQIDSKHLQRNSSAFWNTPPRYSQLPKY